MEIPSLESVVPFQTTYDAFRTQLNTLCLDQFPCGMGSWRDSKIVPPERKNCASIVKDKDPVESKFSVTLKDYPVQTEKIDQLEEFVKSRHSPWQLDYSWSDEARELRETAVKSPWLVDAKYVHGAFRTLKIVNKNVTEVDPEVLRFRNLEELTLSANYLQSVQSDHLPQKLKVLELCGNQIDDLSRLCQRAPPLIHLGLGYNTLSCTDDYITGDIWPNLLSLDLSHNHLTDLFDLVPKLTTLPKLRNLILLGNPLFLLPGYRGFVVDSLRCLQVLDDIRISADEKHNFKGLAKHKDYIFEEVKVRLAVDFIKGLPVPEEVKNPADQPEFPIVNRKYYVEFQYPRGTAFTVHDVVDSVRDETVSMMTSQTPEPSQQGVESDMPATEVSTQRSRSRATDVSQKLSAVDDEDCGLVLAPLRSAELPYAEEVETNWAQIFRRDNLTYMRDFLRQGMEIRVMEEKILSYPADQMNQTPDPKKDKKKDKGKGKVEEKKDDKKNKKKKDLDIELHHMPPVYTTFATFRVPLDDFLDGENDFETVFSHGEPEVEPIVDTTESDKSKKGKKKQMSADKKKDNKKGEYRRRGVKWHDIPATQLIGCQLPSDMLRNS